MKALHKHAAAEHEEIQEANAAYKVPNAREVQERVALDELGLGDGEEALQYALMMSMEEPQPLDPGELVFGGGRIGGSSRDARKQSGLARSTLSSRRQSAPHNLDDGNGEAYGYVDQDGDADGYGDYSCPASETAEADGGYDSEEEALRAVAEFQRNEEREMREVMALIEQAEAKQHS